MSTLLESIMAQAEQKQQAANKGMSMEERMKKYFAAVLPQGKNSAQKRIRILPTPDGSSPFVEAYFHEVQVNGDWVKLYDPNKNDKERSPLHEVYQELMNTGKQSDKELASSYRSRKFYILKVIDRDAPEDGVKFWRFKDHYKGEGVYDKIFPIFKTKGDITDPLTGRDLIIELKKAKSNNGKDYTSIQTIMFEDPQPLSDDKEISEAWLSDELTWRDVYSKKPVEYLEAIAKGEVPKWDGDAGKYIYGNSVASEVIIGSDEPVVKSESTTSMQIEEVDEDLPF